MQWLIDLCVERVIDQIGIPPCFIDRGDPAAYDFRKADLTTDGTWRDMDLSAIVPAGASAVLMRTLVQDGLVAQIFAYRTKGNTLGYNIAQNRTRVANLYDSPDKIVALDADRKIQYYASNTIWTTIDILVAGWWL